MFNNIKVGAISCAAGGAGWAAILFWRVSQNISFADNPWILILLGGTAALIALGSWIFTLSWRRFQLSSVLYMSLGLLAFGTTLVAVGIMGASVVVNLFLLAIVGEAVTSLGLIVFGLMSFTDRKFARWGWLPLLMAAVYIPSFAAADLPLTFPSGTTEILAGLYGIGWLFLGYALYDSTRRSYSKQIEGFSEASEIA